MEHLTEVSPANFLILAGIVFLAVGVFGKVGGYLGSIFGRIEAGEKARVLSGVLGVALLITGVLMHSTEANRPPTETVQNLTKQPAPTSASTASSSTASGPTVQPQVPPNPAGVSGTAQSNPTSDASKQLRRRTVQNPSKQEAPTAATRLQRSNQNGWRWCHKCQGLFFSGNRSQGVCPADSQAHDGSQSGQYAAVFGDEAQGQQAGWRWCHKCQGIFFSGNRSQGVCPADEQPHDGSQSGHYAMVADTSASGMQAGWRWCRKCQGLFFAGNPDQGACPAGGKHDGSASGSYAVPWAQN